MPKSDRDIERQQSNWNTGPMSAEPTLPTKQREKIEEGSPYYNRLAANLALEFCPPINPCGDCGRPTIQGYECTFCREERIGQ